MNDNPWSQLGFNVEICCLIIASCAGGGVAAIADVENMQKVGNNLRMAAIVFQAFNLLVGCTQGLPLQTAIISAIRLLHFYQVPSSSSLSRP